MSTAVANAQTSSFVQAFETATPLPLAFDGSGNVRFPVRARPGLYQFSAVLDASAFDWNELYEVLGERFVSAGARTGPWDFSLSKNNSPLVPAFRVFLDEDYLGIWFFQRVSLEDIEARRFRGRMAFYLGDGEAHQVRLEPMRPMNVRWLSATLEPDPEDTLEPVSLDLAGWDARCPAAPWGDPAFWADLKQKLKTTHARYAEPLERLFAWLRRRREIDPSMANSADAMRNFLVTHAHPEDIVPSLAMYHLADDPQALEDALASVDAAVELEHWGNQNPEGYAHDGDMGAMSYLRCLAWAWHALCDHLGDERRERLRKKLALQGGRFFRLVLLNRDYWGGSVIQDHGWKSIFGFGTAAMHLLGVVPEAELWVAYLLPRLRRSLDATPRDGSIPPSSYVSPYLFLDEPTRCRDTLLALTGEDFFDRAPFRKVIDFLVDTARDGGHAYLVEPNGTTPLIGATQALNRLAQKYGDGRAAYLQERMLEVWMDSFYHGSAGRAYYNGILYGLLSYDPAVEPVEALPAPRRLAFFEDSGLANYHDPEAGATLSVRCGPWCGYTAYRRAQGPCDRLESTVGAGHFILAVGETPVLVTPDGGYRLRAATRNCLLVDGRGPIGDIGYPMSIPSFRARGDEILYARWDEATQTGQIRLNLAPAYDPALGMALYTRDFLLEPGKRIVVRDRVVLDAPHALRWHFHGYREKGVVLEDARTCRVGENPSVRIRALPLGASLRLAEGETEVVYSYASANNFGAFRHARYDTVEPAQAVTVDFELTWNA